MIKEERKLRRYLQKEIWAHDPFWAPIKKKVDQLITELVNAVMREAGPVSAQQTTSVPADIAATVAHLQEENSRLRTALKCTNENCREIRGRYYADCSVCPQGIIRARAGLGREK